MFNYAMVQLWSIVFVYSYIDYGLTMVDYNCLCFTTVDYA